MNDSSKKKPQPVFTDFKRSQATKKLKCSGRLFTLKSISIPTNRSEAPLIDRFCMCTRIAISNKTESLMFRLQVVEINDSDPSTKVSSPVLLPQYFYYCKFCSAGFATLPFYFIFVLLYFHWPDFIFNNFFFLFFFIPFFPSFFFFFAS